MLFQSAVNQKFKTTLCKHWTTQGTCAIGVRCHFAHGKDELRNPQDVLPVTATQTLQEQALIQNYMQGPLGLHNYKAIKCRYNDLGLCKYKDTCHFAHGESELRSPQSDPSTLSQLMLVQQYNQLLQQQQQLADTSPQAIQATQQMQQDILKQQQMLQQYQMQMSSLMNTQSLQLTYNVQQDPTIQRQITVQQLFHILQNIDSNKLDLEEKAKLRFAADLLSAQNVQSCAALLNDIINRMTETKGNKEKFDRWIQEAAQLAVNLLAQYQVSMQNPY